MSANGYAKQYSIEYDKEDCRRTYVQQCLARHDGNGRLSLDLNVIAERDGFTGPSPLEYRSEKALIDKRPGNTQSKVSRGNKFFYVVYGVTMYLSGCLRDDGTVFRR